MLRRRATSLKAAASFGSSTGAIGRCRWYDHLTTARRRSNMPAFAMKTLGAALLQYGSSPCHQARHRYSCQRARVWCRGNTQVTRRRRDAVHNAVAARHRRGQRRRRAIRQLLAVGYRYRDFRYRLVRCYCDKSSHCGLARRLQHSRLSGGASSAMCTLSQHTFISSIVGNYADGYRTVENHFRLHDKADVVVVDAPR